jgi:hypothetical protein
VVSGNPEQFVKFRVIATAPVHRVREKIDQVCVLIVRIPRQNVIQSSCPFLVGHHGLSSVQFVQSVIRGKTTAGLFSTRLCPQKIFPEGGAVCLTPNGASRSYFWKER